MTIAHLASEYVRLRDLGRALLEAGDDEGFDRAYIQAEAIRERIFGTTATTLDDAISKVAFIVAVAQERQGDLTDTGAIDAMADLVLFLEGLKGDGRRP